MSPEGSLSALETLCYNDPEIYADPVLRKIATALALECPDRDDEWLVDAYWSYRELARAGRLHERSYRQDVWEWRLAVCESGWKIPCYGEQLRYFNAFANAKRELYPWAGTFVPYRMENCFGESTFGPRFYEPWYALGERHFQYYAHLVGGVCGNVSMFGSWCAKAHGIPAMSAGQPGHCAYLVRDARGGWTFANGIKSPTWPHRTFWQRGEYAFLPATDRTLADRPANVDVGRLLALATCREERHAPSAEIEKAYRQACLRHRQHYGAWRAYRDWLDRDHASLERLGAWMRSCAKGLEVGRDPLWQFLTPYFERFAKERDARALHDEMIALAPLLRREEKWTPEEPDFAPTLEKWCGLFAPEHRQLAKDVEDALTKAVVR